MVIAFSIYEDKKEVYEASSVERIERDFFHTRIFLKNKDVVEYSNAMWDIITC